MKRSTFTLILAFLAITAARSQDFGIAFSGFVKNDFFYDSRQTVSLREGHFLLYPAAKLPDAAGSDINAAPSVNFLSIQTRLTGAVIAPEAFGAKASGLIEADFFGNESAAFVDANGFRLRHAFAKLAWTNTELLFGQTWHPFFIPNCYSEVLSFNTGAPMQPFSRNPQARVSEKVGPLKFIAALLEQRDFTSPCGSAPLRNSVLPSLDALAQYENKDAESNSEVLCGAGAEYKSITPLLYTEKAGKKFVSDESIAGVSATAFFKYRKDAVTFKLQGLYGQNAYDLTMLGGYAVHAITDTVSNAVSYTTIPNAAVWTEIMVGSGDGLQWALWAGYTEKLAAGETIAFFTNRKDGTDVTVRGAAVDNSSDIKSIFRIAPRVTLVSGKFAFSIETEYTSAAYASKDASGKLLRDAFGKITATESVSNTRVLFAAVLRF